MDVIEARRLLSEGSEREREQLCDVLCADAPGNEALILALMGDSEAAVRRHATWAVANATVRSAPLASALVAALDDVDGEVRAIAVDGIRARAERAEGLPAKLLALMDDEAVGETRAFLALESLGSASDVAVPRAVDALTAARPSAYAAVRMLLALDVEGEDICAAAREGLSHPNPTVRSLAGRWLARTDK